jgi:tetratricopeptide (TPR) repeat protein
VDGDVRQEGGTIRLNVQLVDARSGANIWAQRFQRDSEHFFDVLQDIRERIIKSLAVNLTEEERKRARRRDTDSFAAYDVFLKAQARLVTRASGNDNHSAQQLMEQAIRLDPHFARAYAALALIHADAYRFDWTQNAEATRQQALKIGERALELDDRSPQAYWILGYIYLFLFEDHNKAIALAEKAIELAPADMDAALVLAVTYAFGDDPEKGRLIAQELMQRNERYSALVPSVLGLANIRLGRYPEAVAALDRSLSINPSRIQGNAFRAVALVRIEDSAEAAFQIDDLYMMHPEFDVVVWAARQPFKDRALAEEMKRDLIRAGAHETAHGRMPIGGKPGS